MNDEKLAGLKPGAPGEHPILFSGEMVRAIWDGRKSQTRRAIKLPADTTDVVVDPGGTGLFGPGPYIKAAHIVDGEPLDYPRIRCPYGYPGDRLWVRETFALGPKTKEQFEGVKYEKARGGVRPVFYRASGFQNPDQHKWTPSIFMFRRFSRITLEITAVRVERLQDISEDDAKAEGCRPCPDCDDVIRYRHGYQQLWDKINGQRCPWSKNPRVWRIEFKRL